MSKPVVPRYRQLKASIIQKISSGELKPQDRVPSENELVDSMGVSRMTAHRALRELTDEGYVQRVVGVGTFVADFVAASHALEVRNIADEIAKRGHRHAAEVLRQEEVAADEVIAAALEVDPGAPVFHIQLVHLENTIAIQLENRFVLPAFAPQLLDQDFSVITPSAYFTSIAPLQEAKHVVRAQMPDPHTQARLHMADKEPCLVVVRRTWAHGRPVTFAELSHPGSRFELSGHYVPPGTKTFAQE